MVRTKSQVGVKVGGKSSKVTSKVSRATESIGNDKGKPVHSGGNSYCPRETPSWQKEITKFFGQSSTLQVHHSESTIQSSSSSQNIDNKEKTDEINTENKENEPDNTKDNSMNLEVTEKEETVQI